MKAWKVRGRQAVSAVCWNATRHRGRETVHLFFLFSNVTQNEFSYISCNKTDGGYIVGLRLLGVLGMGLNSSLSWGNLNTKVNHLFNGHFVLLLLILVTQP